MEFNLPFLNFVKSLGFILPYVSLVVIYNDFGLSWPSFGYLNSLALNGNGLDMMKYLKLQHIEKETTF